MPGSLASLQKAACCCSKWQIQQRRAATASCMGKAPRSVHHDASPFHSCRPAASTRPPASPVQQLQRLCRGRQRTVPLQHLVVSKGVRRACRPSGEGCGGGGVGRSRGNNERVGIHLRKEGQQSAQAQAHPPHPAAASAPACKLLAGPRLAKEVLTHATTNAGARDTNSRTCGGRHRTCTPAPPGCVEHLLLEGRHARGLPGCHHRLHVSSSAAQQHDLHHALLPACRTSAA